MRKMTLIFVLTWKATWWTITACPPGPAKVDPYSGEVIQPFTVTLACCRDRNDRNMRKEFSTKKEAEDFIADCPPANSFFGDKTECSEVKIEEIK